MDNSKRVIDGSRISATRACGPQGGLTKWAATLDGELFFLFDGPVKGDTKRSASLKLLDYMRRHPEKMPPQPSE
jgi:hypothetical protein